MSDHDIPPVSRDTFIRFKKWLEIAGDGEDPMHAHLQGGVHGLTHDENEMCIAHYAALDHHYGGWGYEDETYVYTGPGESGGYLVDPYQQGGGGAVAPPRPGEQGEDKDMDTDTDLEGELVDYDLMFNGEGSEEFSEFEDVDEFVLGMPHDADPHGKATDEELQDSPILRKFCNIHCTVSRAAVIREDVRGQRGSDRRCDFPTCVNAATRIGCLRREALTFNNTAFPPIKDEDLGDAGDAFMQRGTLVVGRSIDVGFHANRNQIMGVCAIVSINRRVIPHKQEDQTDADARADIAKNIGAGTNYATVLCVDAWGGLFELISTSDPYRQAPAGENAAFIDYLLHGVVPDEHGQAAPPLDELGKLGDQPPLEKVRLKERLSRFRLLGPARRKQIAEDWSTMRKGLDTDPDSVHNRIKVPQVSQRPLPYDPNVHAVLMELPNRELIDKIWVQRGHAQDRLTLAASYPRYLDDGYAKIAGQLLAGHVKDEQNMFDAEEAWVKTTVANAESVAKRSRRKEMNKTKSQEPREADVVKRRRVQLEKAVKAEKKETDAAARKLEQAARKLEQTARKAEKSAQKAAATAVATELKKLEKKKKLEEAAKLRAAVKIERAAVRAQESAAVAELKKIARENVLKEAAQRKAGAAAEAAQKKADTAEERHRQRRIDVTRKNAEALQRERDGTNRLNQEALVALGISDRPQGGGYHTQENYETMTPLLLNELSDRYETLQRIMKNAIAFKLSKKDDWERIKRAAALHAEKTTALKTLKKQLTSNKKAAKPLIEAADLAMAEIFEGLPEDGMSGGTNDTPLQRQRRDAESANAELALDIADGKPRLLDDAPGHYSMLRPDWQPINLTNDELTQFRRWEKVNTDFMKKVNDLVSSAKACKENFRKGNIDLARSNCHDMLSANTKTNAWRSPPTSYMDNMFTTCKKILRNIEKALADTEGNHVDYYVSTDNEQARLLRPRGRMHHAHRGQEFAENEFPCIGDVDVDTNRPFTDGAEASAKNAMYVSHVSMDGKPTYSRDFKPSHCTLHEPDSNNAQASMDTSHEPVASMFNSLCL